MSKISTILRDNKLDKNQLNDLDSVSVSALDFDFEQGGIRRINSKGNSRIPSMSRNRSRSNVRRRVGKSPIIKMGGRNILHRGMSNTSGSNRGNSSS